MNSVSTVRIDTDADPVAVGARTGLLWRNGQFVLAGVGVRERIVLARPDGAAEAQRHLAGLAGTTDLDLPGTGPVAFAALPFAPDVTGELIVPELVLGRGPEGRRWLTATDISRPAVAAAIGKLEGLATPFVADPPNEFRLRSTVPAGHWRDEMVGGVRKRIRDGGLTKAVLARELVLDTDRPLDRAEILHRLGLVFPAAMVFCVEDFLGASPELLVARSGDVVRAHPLAGTAPRGADPGRDQQLAAGLLASAKDRSEHRITIDWLLDTLLPFCSYVDAEADPTIVSLANVHHLGTRVEGRLSAPAASVLELVAALHPTPAVGGDPQPEALALIAEIEGDIRGRYAGPVGWVDARGNGAFAVGIRSATVEGTEARLLAGVGVVADSDPSAELAETQAKFQAMLGALLRP